MNKGWLIGIVVAVLVIIVFFGVWFKKMGIRQHEIALANQYEAQANVVETALFRMRTTIKNIHNCTDEWADKFIEVVAAQSKGRPGNFAEQGSPPAGGDLMALGGTGYKESDSLGIPSDMHMKLANAIEGQLANFVRQQEIQTDVWRAHKTYCEDPKINEFWGVPLLVKVKPKPEMITSGETKVAVETKRMSEELF